MGGFVITTIIGMVDAHQLAGEQYLSLGIKTNILSFQAYPDGLLVQHIPWREGWLNP